MAWIGLRRRLSSSLSWNRRCSRASALCAAASAAGARASAVWAEAGGGAGRRGGNSNADRTVIGIFRELEGSVLPPYDSASKAASPSIELVEQILEALERTHFAVHAKRLAQCIAKAGVGGGWRHLHEPASRSTSHGLHARIPFPHNGTNVC